MIVVPPIPITTGMVVTNAVDEAAWAAGTTYAAGVLVSRGGRRWLSLLAGNLGKTPETEPTWWKDKGLANTMAMFDDSLATLTTRAGPLTVTITPGQRATAIGFSGLVGSSITLTVRNDAAVLYTSTRELLQTDGTDWDWYFGEPRQVGDTYWYDLPPLATSYEVTIAGASTACGLCVIGRQEFIGDAEYGVNLSTELRGRDYIDASGNPVAVERGHSRTLSATLHIERTAFNRVTALFESLVQRNALWIVAPDLSDYDSAITYGRYQRAVRALSTPMHITVGLEVGGNL